MALRDEAIDFMRSGDFGTALPIFERLISMDHDDAGLHYMAGQCARFSGDFAKAVDSTRGTHWVQVAIGAAMFVCASDNCVTRLAWPGGEGATKEIAQGSHSGLFWVDHQEAEGNITRVFLPNFFNTVHSLLRRDALYANLLGNLGSVLDLLGQHSEAETCIAEAQEFLSGRGPV